MSIPADEQPDPAQAALHKRPHVVSRIERPQAGEFKFRFLWLKLCPDTQEFAWTEHEWEKFEFPNFLEAQAEAERHENCHVIPLSRPSSHPQPRASSRSHQPHQPHHRHHPDPGEIKLFGYGLDD